MKRQARKVIGAVTLFAALLWSAKASGQDAPPYECDDQYGQCGTPQQSGGGGGGGGGGSILINNTDLGITYQYADDYDNDGVEDPYDNCPFVPNVDQADDDGDGVGTACDNCPNNSNVDQFDLDGDTIGDACDGDIDGDGFANGNDICPSNPDPLQKDADEDGIGDACDPDMDGDGVDNLDDNCPLVKNPDQADTDPDMWGDACDDDDDGDGITNTKDNCLSVANEAQGDVDGDKIGDACDPDIDNDTVANQNDNCPALANVDQADDDHDGLGNACDDKFCYVVDSDVENCLDPAAPFKVISPTMSANPNDEVRLRIFANRANQPMRYTFSVISAPNHSYAAITNPAGAVSISTPFEYHYLKDKVVTFTPDEPGTYKIKLQAKLVWDDVVTGQSNAAAETIVLVNVAGDTASGCSATPSYADAGLIMFALLGIVVLIRRKK